MEPLTVSLRALRLAPLALLLPTASLAQAPANLDAMIQDAMSAAPSTVAVNATVMDWARNVLRQGSNGWTCFPAPPGKETGPMCLDASMAQWADAWMNRKPVTTNRVGVAYMLQGDAGSSNTDPHATSPAANNEWVVAGPHTMIFVPDASLLEGLPTDPGNGGPWVMWKGTPYVHIMVPVN